ncbi:inorganic diphosphatase [Deltaproteobacteria bacterium Smac51]|nr:inorganic diphosphatase [Deltaproteobacteria bacterium Smac51]
MNIDKISLGANPPYEFNVIIEIPQGGLPVKYEMDKESGAMYVDRFLNTSMTYPANYGFIPHTLAADGDPCDVLVLDRAPVIPGAVIRARPIGALVMTDEAGADDKIIAVPIDKLNPYYAELKSPDDMPKVLRDQVAHFFQHYKDLEKGKWVAGLHWVGYEEALELVAEGIRCAVKKTTVRKGRAGAPKPAASTKKAAAPKTTKKAASVKSSGTGKAAVKKSATARKEAPAKKTAAGKTTAKAAVRKTSIANKRKK